ncbi:hypothetical protein B0O99DRAFT_502949 [Bisporella sp. PMI_857]|nr:hypothetical protein B0O99DRAFT_502949 [Bisporella sp. PMI_857]
MGKKSKEKKGSKAVKAVGGNRAANSKAIKKAAKAAGQNANGVESAHQSEKKRLRELRRATKTQKRKHEKRITREQWAVPPPSNLVAKLDAPKSKYHSYFEFAENTEKKEKKLEFQVTKNTEPPPGYKFVPIGDPIMTNKCKELSREQDAMIFIVSESNEKMSKISEHVHRTGYHFREYIVDEARNLVGETITSTTTAPIPKTQEEINKQADAAIRDLFPRIPNTDRQMIIDHAFKLGSAFKGVPVVGLQVDLPLSRRVQLAVLAHIRHTHTRYDLLLKETTWENARKVVEPVCLDFIIKWRGDEETGRDQMDEILREIVVISDSEDSDDSSEEDDDSSDDEGDLSSTDSDIIMAHQPDPPQRLSNIARLVPPEPVINFVQKGLSKPQVHGHRSQRGFKRYQAAWDEAVNRRNHHTTIFDGYPPNRDLAQGNSYGSRNMMQHTSQSSAHTSYPTSVHMYQE